MKITKEFIIEELNSFSEYNIDELNSLSLNLLQDIFKSHCDKYAIEVEAGNLVNNYQNVDFLIDTPDGFLGVGDFWEKSNKDIITIKTNDEFSASVSTDHLFETSVGWVHAGDITKKHYILTKNGYRKVSYINRLKNKETVYDWEILHPNHRYWAGNGLSSHNTGKTYLLLNAIKQAQDLGYSIIFYDSENAVDKELVEKFGIDSSKFRYEPCNTVQDFRSSVTSLTDLLIEKKNKGLELPKILIALDSAGNLATQKEIDDAKSGSDKADMTRAKLLKSTFRILMTKLGICKIPFIFTNHSYQTQDLFSRAVQGGGCLLPGSLILMADGTYKEIENINEGDYVQTLQGEKEIEKVWEFEKPAYLIEFENGTSLGCSIDHRFFIGNLDDDPLDDSNWIKVKDLVEGDEISIISLKY